MVAGFLAWVITSRLEDTDLCDRESTRFSELLRTSLMNYMYYPFGCFLFSVNKYRRILVGSSQHSTPMSIVPVANTVLCVI